MKFKDKVAVITGAASGMGAATARGFAEQGGKVIIVDRNETLAQEVANEIDAIAMIGDISDSTFCNSAIRKAVDEFGKLDVLVNAAGIIVRKDTLDTDDETWQQVMNVNVNGLFFMSRAAIEVMQPQGQGSIVNFGSIWGGVGAAGVIAYCASKGAVHQITRSMALEYVKDGIRINAVCPGEVNTPMIHSERNAPVTTETIKIIEDSVPMGRLAEPEEIAQVASNEASYMTGAMIEVDAGYTAR